MKSFTLPALAALIASVAGCGSNATTSPARVAAGAPSVIIEEPVATRLWPLDPYTLVSIATDGDEMVLVVSYAGGCKPHRFQLVADRTGFVDGDPISRKAILSHDAGGDECEALITEELRFDLSALRDAYLRQYLGANRIIELCIEDRSGGLDCVEYEF